MKADLHVHSTASDGRLSPRELIQLAARNGVSIIAITDHDTVDGIIPALESTKDFPSVRVIPGVEISASSTDNEVHILGYFVNPYDPILLDTLDHLRASRRIRSQRMVSKLAGLGLSIDWQRIQELAANGSIGRPHVAQAMLERGYVLSFKQAFKEYIGRGRPAYVEREKITPEDAVELIVKADGLPVLAHPANISHLENTVRCLQKAGLVGIETYYGDYTPSVRAHLASLAQKYELIACGGSDYHAFGDAEETPLGGVDIPSENVDRLLSLQKSRVESSNLEVKSSAYSPISNPQL